MPLRASERSRSRSESVRVHEWVSFRKYGLGSFAALMSEGGLIGRRWSVYALAQDFLVCYVFESNDALVYALFFCDSAGTCCV